MKTSIFPAHYRLPDKLGWLGLRVFSIAVLLFLLLPIFVIVPLSFSSGSFLAYPLPGWSLQWYEELFSSPEWARAARNSFIVAPLATLLATTLGTLAAMGLARTRFVGRGLLSALLISPMVVPIVVVAVSTYLVFARIGLSESYLGLVLVHAALGAPFVVTTVLATLQGFNHNLVRASLSLGASPLETFFKVTLPVIAPGVISGALFAFAASFDEVVVTLFLAGPDQVTLPRQMFTGIRENISPVIAAVATILILFSTALLLALEWLRGRVEAKTVRLETPAVTIKAYASGLKLTWGEVPGATVYNVYRAAAGDSYAKIGTSRTLAYADRTVESGVKYSYYVAAQVSKFVSARSSTVTATAK